jgi:hypothetical protein
VKEGRGGDTLAPRDGSVKTCPTVVLHAAMRLLEQAKPQTLYTQILNYNAPKALQYKRFVFTVHRFIDRIRVFGN